MVEAPYLSIERTHSGLRPPRAAHVKRLGGSVYAVISGDFQDESRGLAFGLGRPLMPTVRQEETPSPDDHA